MRLTVYLTSFIAFVVLITWLVISISSMKPRASKNRGPTKVSRKVTTKPRAKKVINVNTIQSIQLILNQKGAKLEINGKLDKQTQKALREFQKKNKLQVTGRTDQATLSKLGIVLSDKK